jgi:hypothetical protein
VLARFGHLEHIPPNWKDWHVNAASAGSLSRTLVEQRDRALLFRRLATLQTDIALFDDVENLKWNGPTPEFEQYGSRLDAAITQTSSGPRRRSS